MTGDLGGSIIAQEREWGLEPDWNVPPATDFRPSDIDEADRARRLTNAKLADQADKAGIFFDLSSRPPAAAGTAVPTAPPLGAGELLALAARPFQAAPADPNNQAGKLEFAEASPGRPTSNPYRLEAPASPYQVMAGTLIPASLITAINSDLPGAIAAQVTQPVYDTVTGTFLLIPQGARLIGRYQSEISPGQNRVLVVWDRIIFPDGTSLRMAEQGSDTAGSAGLSDRADHHWSRIFAGAGLTTLLAIGTEAGSDDESDLERAVRRGFGDSISEAGQRVADRELGVQPTLTVRPGWPVRVLVTKDMVLRPYPTL